MKYEYEEIVRKWYEELKPLFINYLHKNFNINYDDIMDIYSQVWIDVRNNIRRGKVEPGTKWKSYILKMGWNQASKMASRRYYFPSLDDEEFNREQFEKEYTAQKEAEASIYNDPDLQAVLAAELSYIPDPCNKILKLYYFDNLSMREIADTMNYSSERSAISTKSRCLDKIRDRVMNVASRLGIIG